MTYTPGTELRAASAMTRNVICLDPSDMLEDAAALMAEWHIRHLPVVQGGQLLGVVTDRDVLSHQHGAAGSRRIAPLPVREVMSPAPMTCRPSSTISYVAGLMIDHKIDCVPVTDVDGRLVGLVTTTDLLQLLRDRDDTEHLVIPFDFRLRARNGEVAA